ncbi:MAG: response regulator transcription factor [Chloroflexi bacterium]|nr:response regulator transcription factor [Chloroflexota bacterium]
MRLLIVDDHEVVRQGLRTLLDRREGLEVAGEAGSVAEAVREAARLSPDVVVMDVRLPDGTGVEACREIRSANPAIRVIMLTSYPDEEAVFDSIMAGASGYLLKQIRGQELVQAIRRVGAGESLLDPGVTHKVLERIKSLAGQKVESATTLSEQEEKILARIADGKTNKEIATDLFLSEKTVKNYVSSILDKLNLSRRAEAAAYYVRRYGKRESSG